MFFCCVLLYCVQFSSSLLARYYVTPGRGGVGGIERLAASPLASCMSSCRVIGMPTFACPDPTFSLHFLHSIFILLRRSPLTSSRMLPSHSLTLLLFASDLLFLRSPPSYRSFSIFRHRIVGFEVRARSVDVSRYKCKEGETGCTNPNDPHDMSCRIAGVSDDAGGLVLKSSASTSVLRRGRRDEHYTLDVSWTGLTFPCLKKKRRGSSQNRTALAQSIFLNREVT